LWARIANPRYQSEQAFKLLLEEMQARKDFLPFTPRTIELETSVIERESSF
jgi:LacI family transcriptional regulator